MNTDVVLFLSLFFCLLHGLLQHISQGVSHSLLTVNLYLLKKGFSFCLPLEPGTKMSYCVIYTLFFDPRHPSEFCPFKCFYRTKLTIGQLLLLKGDFALYSKSRGEFSSTVANFVIIVPPYSGIHSTSSRCHARTRRCHKNARL